MRKKIESIQRISKAEILKEKGQYGILYEWSEPTEKIRSQYGHITIKKWMEKENERINKKGGDAKVICLDGKVALFVKLRISKVEIITNTEELKILKEKGKYGILYKWSEPTEEIRSQYGHITIKKWMEKENERINKKGGVAKVIGLNGKIALFVK